MHPQHILDRLAGFTWFALASAVCVGLAIAWLPPLGYCLYCGWVAAGAGVVADARPAHCPPASFTRAIEHLALAHVWPAYARRTRG